MCGHHARLPKALKIPICYDRTSVAQCRGGFADVWKGEHCGRDVAVKVLRTYSNSDLKKIISVGPGCVPFPCVDVLTRPYIEVLQRGRDVEIPPASKRTIPSGSDDDRGSVRNGIRVDGEWEYKRLREGTSGCR